MDNNERFPGNDIHPTAVIGPNVTMGIGNYIGPYCVIGMPGEHREKWGEDRGVMIGDNNTLTGLVTVDSGISKPTAVADSVMIMKHAHIGHDAYIDDAVTVSCGAKIGGHTLVGHHSNIGLNAVVHQNHSIKEHCMIAMGAVVTLKCITRSGCMYAGNPAIEKGRNKKAPECIFEEDPSVIYPPVFPEKYQSGNTRDYEINPNRHYFPPVSGPEVKKPDLPPPGSYQTCAILPRRHPYNTAPTIVKLPISVIDNKQVELGIDNPEEGTMTSYFDVNHIIVVREAHDDSLGHSPINAEATMIHLTSGDTFFIPMHIDEVRQLIDNADKQKP